MQSPKSTSAKQSMWSCTSVTVHTKSMPDFWKRCKSRLHHYAKICKYQQNMPNVDTKDDSTIMSEEFFIGAKGKVVTEG